MESEKYGITFEVSLSKKQVITKGKGDGTCEYQETTIRITRIKWERKLTESQKLKCKEVFYFKWAKSSSKQILNQFTYLKKKTIQTIVQQFCSLVKKHWSH